MLARLGDESEKCRKVDSVSDELILESCGSRLFIAFDTLDFSVSQPHSAAYLLAADKYSGPLRAGCLVSINWSSALETRFQPFVSPSWSASEHISAAYFHEHRALPFLRPAGAGAAAVPGTIAPL
jgi:hypothetical protein